MEGDRPFTTTREMSDSDSSWTTEDSDLSACAPVDLHGFLLRTLQCPGCSKYMIPPIMLCSNGHCICSNCTNFLNCCPSCQGCFLSTRCLSMENLAKQTIFPCENHFLGCKENITASAMSEHEDTCAYAFYSCPFDVISKIKCVFRGPLCNMKSHIQKCHRRLGGLAKTVGKTLTSLPEILGMRKLQISVDTFDELFHVTFEIRREQFYCACFYVGPRGKSREFAYKMYIGELVLCHEVFSYPNGDETDGSIERGINIPLQVVLDNMKDTSQLSMNIGDAQPEAPPLVPFDIVNESILKELKCMYAIRKVQDNREGLELNGLHQLPVYADNVTVLGENPQSIRENTGILLEASKEIGLEVNPEKTKYMIMSRDENIVRNGNIKIGNLSFEEVEMFKYLGATVTNINDTREEIKHRINMGNACYFSVEKLLSSSLLSKNLKVRIYKTVILPVVLYGCETWTRTLREEQRLRVFENKVLRKIFGAKRDEVTGECRKLHNAELHALYTSPDIIMNI
ncbi:hypothetical protein ANN_13882 [Periplaneta americana]|uniref:RING-type E3 ubiquitin transferase n=1 Tax=Periplaneta americana TaxID=6978 RepID=A0ABQ8SVS4_PERAM|nr:hypothetical protein ANN_13882 [Periplaneta americana]